MEIRQLLSQHLLEDKPPKPSRLTAAEGDKFDIRFSHSIPGDVIECPTLVIRGTPSVG